MAITEGAILGSATWAAYGDALGFITELADSQDRVAHRCGTGFVEEPLPWRRRIGGRSGVEVQLPAGAYSDDTQLRLATSRAIRGDGEFDVDAFARIELVAWQAYHLGAGRGSKAAAAGMARSDARWNQNTFDTKSASYVQVGGNGAAMRIQPHVWSLSHPTDIDSLLNSVIRDTIVTHGHPHGILGACLHALVLARTLSERAVPGPESWDGLVEGLSHVPRIVSSDDELRGLWLPSWENAARADFSDAIFEALGSAHEAASKLAEISKRRSDDRSETYRSAVEAVGGFDPATRGSGLGTAWLATYVAATTMNPAESMVMVANTLGTDTDTIATMAGALMGALVGAPPPGPLQDMDVVVSEAQRMHQIASGRGAASFRYPDLLTWNPPRGSLDLIGVSPGYELELAGLGPLTAVQEPLAGGRRDSPTLYRWSQIARTGQHILVRHRAHVGELLPTLRAPELPVWSEADITSPAGPEPSRGRRASSPSSQGQHRHSRGEEPTLFDDVSEVVAEPPLAVAAPRSIDFLVEDIAQRGFEAEAIGRALLGILTDGRSWRHERAAAFAAALVQEHSARREPLGRSRTGETRRD